MQMEFGAVSILSASCRQNSGSWSHRGAPPAKKKKRPIFGKGGEGWGGYREYKYAPLFETNSLVFSLGTRTSEQLSWWNSGR